MTATAGRRPITVLGVTACSLGTPSKDTAAKLMSAIGAVAAALALVVATGSLTPLSLLVAAIVLLWVDLDLAARASGSEARTPDLRGGRAWEP